MEETFDDIETRAKLVDSYNTLMANIELSPEQQDFITNKLGSKKWRLNNLYMIRDKNAVKMTLKLNAAQRHCIYEHTHNKKIILKTRQRGISTLYLAYYLDSCIYTPGYQAGIQSYGLDETGKLQTRAKFMLDEYDEDILALMNITIVSNNSKGITFSNGSILKIGNFRGDTLQGLHVSELAKISAKYPEKAKELKTGAFQAVSVNNCITVESTSEGPTGLFHDMWIRAVLRKQTTDKLTPLDFEPIFLGWTDDPDCLLAYEYPIKERHIAYFEDIAKELNMGGTEETYEALGFDRPSLTNHQKWWAAAKMEELGMEDFNKEYPASARLAFEASIEGTYFRHQYVKLLEDNRVGIHNYNPSYPVDVSFDIGVNDEHVMLFCQVIDGIPYIINEHHATGQGIEYYVEILRKLPYFGNYGIFIMPHDMNVTDYSTGRTRMETFRRNGINNIKLLKRLSFADSIEAARQFIDVLYISNSCENTLLGIQNYRKKYDKRLEVYLDTDEHDIHSNYMAALRYMAQGVSYYKLKLATPKTRQAKMQEYAELKQSCNDFAI